MTEKQCYTVGIYCRLSLDDERQGESSSITTQKQILENYVKSKKWIVGKVYTDDGYSVFPCGGRIFPTEIYIFSHSF